MVFTRAAPFRAWALSAVAPLVVACAGSAPSAASPEHHHALHLPPVGSSVTVLLDGEPRDVDVASAAGSGKGEVPLATVVQTAWPNVDVGRLHVDLVGSDGFRPMSRPKCTHLLTGGEAAHLSLAVASHDVSVDSGLDLPGCYHVRAVVRVEATTDH